MRVFGAEGSGEVGEEGEAVKRYFERRTGKEWGALKKVEEGEGFRKEEGGE